MPREGSGHVADNAIEQGENLTHGAPTGKEGPTSSGVDRSNKAAPPPEPEAGEGIGPTGQASDKSGSGKGPIESTVDEQAEKLSK